MSATIMRHPRDWAALTDGLRARVGPLADVKMGVGLNFNRLGACVEDQMLGGVQVACPGSQMCVQCEGRADGVD